MSAPYQWIGLAKLVEESGEVQQILGKIILFPNGNHPDGKGDLVKRIEDEIGDLYNALDFFIRKNSLNVTHIQTRRAKKAKKFAKWYKEGLL